MEVEEIRCFQHCVRDRNIMCFSVPFICPICGQDTRTTELRIPPFIIESPFTNAEYTQWCIVIKPTVGHFLTDFTDQSNLHVGLTDAHGTVYEFDERGVTVGGKTWDHCLRIAIVKNGQENQIPSERNNFDKPLKQCVADRLWRKECYDEKLHNCYDFVLYCLRKMGLDRDIPCLVDRSLFCRQMIIPETVKAGRYISLYREIDRNGFVIQSVLS